jgi:beta-lactamase regulating signal transducer with metallopeptidase domain
MTLAPLVETSARWVIQASWQAAALAIVVAAIQALLGRRLEPRVRYALWGVVVARLLMPFTLPSRVSAWNLLGDRFLPSRVPTADVRGAPSDPLADWEQRLELRSGAVGDAAPRVAPAPSPSPRQPSAIAAPWLIVGSAWLAGAVLLLARLMGVSVRLHARLRSLPPITSPALIDLLRQCAVEVGLRSPPRLLRSAAGGSPALVGWWRPAMLLPSDLVADEPPLAPAMRLLVLHELTHQLRRDVAVNWLLSVLAAVHWFNPVLWWSFARIRADRELACDAAVLERARDAGERRAYGRLMLKLVVEACARPDLPAGAVGIGEGARQIKRRLAMIIDPRRPSRPASLLAASLALAAAVVTLTQATRAQEKRGASVSRSGSAIAHTQPSRIDAAVAAAAAAAAAGSSSSSSSGYSAPAAAAGGHPLQAVSAGAIFTADELAEHQLNARTADRLRRAMPEFSYGATALAIVLDTFGKDAGVDVNVDWRSLEAAGVDKSTLIDLKSHDAPAARVLDMILDYAGGGSVQLDYRISAGAVHVSTAETIAKTASTVVYDVRDLMGDLQDKALETKMKSLVRLIVDSVNPDSWRDNGGSVGSILSFESKLIVCQSSRAQEQIAILLEKLKAKREQRPQAGSEARP